jgi:hypothetical protein
MNWLLRVPAVLLVSVGLAQAHGFGPVAAVRGGSFAVQQQADAAAYYVVVQHEGFAPQELQVVPWPTGFLLAARQGAGGGAPGFGAYSVSQFSQWVALPPDADVGRAQRRDEPGRILIVVPRRPAGSW